MLVFGPVVIAVGLDWTAPTTIQCHRPKPCATPCAPECTVVETTMRVTTRDRHLGDVTGAEVVTEVDWNDDHGFRTNVRLHTQRGSDWLLFWWTEADSLDEGHHGVSNDLNRYIRSTSQDAFSATVHGEAEGYFYALLGLIMTGIGLFSAVALYREIKARPY